MRGWPPLDLSWASLELHGASLDLLGATLALLGASLELLGASLELRCPPLYYLGHLLNYAGSHLNYLGPLLNYMGPPSGSGSAMLEVLSWGCWWCPKLEEVLLSLSLFLLQRWARKVELKVKVKSSQGERQLETGP